VSNNLQQTDKILPEIIKDGLKTEVLGKTVFYLPTVQSTNTEAKKGGDDGLEEGCVYIAGKQTGGRGRKGRKWISEMDTDICMSVLLRPCAVPVNAGRITLIAGIALCRAIYDVTGLQTEIKWPNDILHNGKKICGILTEMAGKIDKLHYLVVGIGINVNNEKFPEEIRDTATSIYMETRHKTVRNRLIQSVLYYLEKYYKYLFGGGSDEAVINEYKTLSATLNRRIKTVYNNEQVTGRCTDILVSGELLLDCDDGRRITVCGGEVSAQRVVFDISRKSGYNRLR